MSLRISFSLLTWFLVLLSPAFAEPLKLAVQAESAILYNPDTQSVLFEKNAYQPQYPASITKVATAIWALKLKANQINQPVEISGDVIASVPEETKKKANYTLDPWLLVPGATVMGLKKGEILSLKELIYGMMLISAGDAANAIAEYSGGNIPHFMKGVNAYVKSLGCEQTHFENPSGLFHPDQKTCAYDMALIMSAGLKDPIFRSVISTVSHTRPKTNKQPAATLIQSNKLMRPGAFEYSKAIGGKTGYLQLAQNTFVVAAKYNERTLIAVLLKTKDRNDLWKDAIKLFDAAFKQPKTEKVFLKKGMQKASIQEETFANPLLTYTESDLSLNFYAAEEPEVKALVFWDNELSAPIKAGQKVGEVHLVSDKNVPLSKTTLFAANLVKPTWQHTFYLFFMTGSLAMIVLKWALSLGTLLGLGYLAIPRPR